MKSKFRHEIKYVVAIKDAEAFFEDLMPYCDYDKHAGITNSYEVCSVYYDTEDFQFYTDREESVGYRRKIRLRTYNENAKAKALFIEIKEKHKQFVSKKRVNLKSLDLLDRVNHHNQIPLDQVIAEMEDTADAREISYLHKSLGIYPVVMIRYLRRPLMAKFEQGLRITLDTRITAGGTSLPVYDPHAEKLVCDADKGVLEIKSNQNIPLWLSSVMKRHNFIHTRFSKYCLGVDAVFNNRRPWLKTQSISI